MTVTISARSLVSRPFEVLAERLATEFNVEYDDGVVVPMDYRSALINKRAWGFHEKFPLTPLLPHLSIDDVLGGGAYGKTSHSELLARCLKETYYAYEGRYGRGKHQGSDVDELKILMDHLSSLIYSDIVTMMNCYYRTLDARDFAYFIENDAVKTIVSEMEPTQEGVQVTYQRIRKLIDDPMFMPTNNLCNMIRARLVKIDQALQCVIVRGFTTDIDFRVFKDPILSNYFNGLRTPSELAMDSRQASIAEISTKEELRRSQYLARRIKLITVVLEGFHEEDCGSREYFEFNLEAEHKKNFFGQYVLNEDTGMLDVFSEENAESYLGQKARFRSIIHCGSKHPRRVCRTCYGEAAKVLSDHNNIGNNAAIETMQTQSQNLLGIKHLLKSMFLARVELPKGALDFFAMRKNQEDGDIYLNRATRSSNLKIYIPSTRVALPTGSKTLIGGSGLQDVFDADKVVKLNPFNVTEMLAVTVSYDKKGDTFYDTLTLGQDRRFVSLSMEALLFIKESNKVTLDENRNYVIDLDGWNYSDPIFIIPEISANIAEKVAILAKLLESNPNEIEKRDTLMSPDTILAQLIDLLGSSGFEVHILSVLALCYSIVSAQEYDYGLPKNHTDSGAGVAQMIFRMRSASGLLAYQEYDKALENVYIYENKSLDHPYDTVVDPHGVYLQQVKEGNKVYGPYEKQLDAKNKR